MDLSSVLGDDLNNELGSNALTGSLWKNKQNEAHTKALADAARAYEEYRPLQGQNYQNSLNSQLSMYQPVQNALGKMYGPDAQTDYTQASQSPIDPETYKVGKKK